jgi:hypothetical protein
VKNLGSSSRVRIDVRTEAGQLVGRVELRRPS